MTVMAGQSLAEISGYSPIWLEPLYPRHWPEAPASAAGQRDAHSFSWRAICWTDHRHPAERAGHKQDDYRAGRHA